MGCPYLHIKPSQYEYRSVDRSQIFKQNSIIVIHSSFITFIVICDLQLWGRGRWVGGYLEYGGVSYTHAHTHACMHLDAKIYIYKICKWLPSWVSCMWVWDIPNTCACTCPCMWAWGTSHTPTTQSTHPHPQGRRTPQNQ